MLKLFYLLVLFAIILLIQAKNHYGDDSNSISLSRYRRALFGKCVQDKECKPTEYCDHQWPNPIGSCKIGFKNGDKCILDRHCGSKVCHTFRCVPRRPVKDGPCQKENHDECIPEQYCNKNKCRDRKCNGWCKHSYECLSAKCELFRCKRTPNCK